MEKHLSNITIDDEAFYIFTNMPSSLGKFTENSTDEIDYFDVSVSNGKEVYCGKVSVPDVLKSALLVDIEMDKFYNTLRQCLCNADGNSSTLFSYHMIKNDDSSLKFVWKQILDEEMKFQLGSMPLWKEDNQSVKTLEIFAFLSQQLNELKDEVSQLTKKNRNLQLENKGMTKRLEGYVLTKESLEQHLFTKFALVLNEKKERIRQLKEKMEKADKEDSTASHSNGDTDTDEEKERTAKIKAKTNREKESTNPDIILEGNIVGNEDDMPKKKRKRVIKSKPESSSCSILPRGSSISRPPTQSREINTSVVKEAKPTETTEDLLDQLMSA